MDQVARAAIRLFEDGISHRLGRFYGICVGFKGDAPFLAKAAKLQRSFMSVSGKHKGICPYCEAGSSYYARIVWKIFLYSRFIYGLYSTRYRV